MTRVSLTLPGLWLRWTAFIALTSATAAHSAEDDEIRIRVGGNIQVSAEREQFPHMEVIAAADPNNPERLIVGSMIGYAPEHARQSVAYRTADGGKTWQLALERREQTPPHTFIYHSEMSGDPAVAFGPEGAVYYASLGRRGFFRSTDGGKTWKDPVAIKWRAPLDREFLAVDCTNGPFRGQIYWNSTSLPIRHEGERRTPALLFTSRDGGESFVAPVVHIPEDGHVVMTSNSVVLSDGTVAFLCAISATKESRATHLTLLRSPDGGHSIQRTASTAGTWQYRQDGLPMLAADATQGKFKDCLYAVWASRSGDDEVIVFSHSAEQGESWSESEVMARISDAQGSVFLPTVAVNRDGIVAVAWYDTTGLPDGQGWNIRLCASRDGGKTWSSPVQVNSVPMLFEQSKESKKGFYGRDWAGHTAGLCADSNGVFHPVWIDNRTGIRQVWTAAVAIETDRTGKGEAGGGEMGAE